MKRRIEQLLNGIFEYESPELILSKERICLTVKPGDKYRGSFELDSGTRKKVKGFVYSSDARMAYAPLDFAALHEKIVFEFDSVGMEEGEVLEGAFTICSNVGEYVIPYQVTICRYMAKNRQETVKSLDDFAKLAKEDFQKAYLIFLSSEFKRMLYEQEPGWVSLYEGIAVRNLSYRSLEEFLIGCKRKEPVKIQMEDTSNSFSKLTQSVKETILLTKNAWGFLRLDISTDADFLSVERPVVTTDEFIGSTYSLDYVIEEEKLHAGRNFGRILISSPFQTWEYEVTVYKERKTVTRDKLIVQQRQVARILLDYVDFRLKRINMHTWIQKSQEALEAYEKAGGNDTMLTLFAVQLHFAQDRADEACMLLNELDQHKEKLNTPEILGYYLYLTTFYNKDQQYIDYVEERIGSLLLQNPENWKLQWFLLYIQDKYRQHPGEKLDAIRQQYVYGCRSRIMYLEAYYVLIKFPMLLKKLDAFEIKVLQFICRENLLTREISMQISDHAGRCKEYSEELFAILTFCHKSFPSKPLLFSICSLLIKAHKVGKEYFEWYEKGVEEDLRITGLYEYYVESLEGRFDKPLPQIIRMYFSYNNTLGYKKKAAVYANVIRNQKADPQTFQSYRPAMEKFMLDQLAAGRINDDLSLIYQKFLNRNALDKKLAQWLTKAIFTWEITCEAKKARQVVVLHQQLLQEQCVNLVDGKAFVQIYTRDYQIFFVDEEENRYAGSLPYEQKRVMDVPEFHEYCRELAPESPGLILNICGEADETHPVTSENAGSFCSILGMEEVKESYKEKVRRELLAFYAANPKEPSLYEFLHRIDYPAFIKTDKKKLIELLAEEGMCREAFELLRAYGPEHVSSTPLVRICSRTILDMECQQDDMLTAFSYLCFQKGKYGETILSYLLRYYDGPVEQMKALWRVGRQFELDAYELEEKILIMILYMRCRAEDTEDIFDSYRRKMGKKMLIQAYVIYRSYDYFIKEIPVKQPVFVYLERWYDRGTQMEDMCRLALLRYYAELPALSEKQQEHTQKLLEEYTHRGMRFAFFKKFDLALGRAFGMQDKSYVEYRTNPEAAVTLHYRIEQDNGEITAEGTEPMRNVYEGVFVKEVILFQGEMFIYRIAVELDGKTEELPEEVLIWEESKSPGNTKYDLLNRISGCLEKKDLESARSDVLLYQEQEALARQVFTLM